MATIRIFSLFFFLFLFSEGTAQVTYGAFDNALKDFGKEVAIFKYDSSIIDEVNQIELSQLKAFHIEKSDYIDTIFHKLSSDSNSITKTPDYQHIYKINKDGTRYKYTNNNGSSEQLIYNKENVVLQKKLSTHQRHEIIDYNPEQQITCKYIGHLTGYSIQELDKNGREIHAQEYNKFWNHLSVRNLDTIAEKAYRITTVLNETDTVGFRQTSLDGKFFYRMNCWDSSSTLSERGKQSDFFYREDIRSGYYEETIKLPGVYEFQTKTYDNDSLSTVTVDSQKITSHFRNNEWLSKEIEYNPTPGNSRNRTQLEMNFGVQANPDYGKDVMIYSSEHPYQVAKRLFYTYQNLSYDSVSLNHKVIGKPSRWVEFTYNKYGNRKKITLMEDGEKTVSREWENYFLRWKRFKIRLKNLVSFRRKRSNPEVYQRPYMPIAEMHQLAEFGITTSLRNNQLDLMREHLISFHTDTNSIRLSEIKGLLSKTESRTDTTYTVNWVWQNDTCVVLFNNERIAPGELANRLVEKVRFYGNTSNHTVLPVINELHAYQPQSMHNCWLWVPTGNKKQFTYLGDKPSMLEFTWKIK